MSDFLDARAALQNSRSAWADAKKEHYLKQQQQRLQELKIKGRLRQERRVFLPDDDPDQVLLNEIQGEVYQLQVALEERDNEVKRGEEALDQTGSAIRQVAQLNDHLPIMLLPVRLQTRFVTVKHVTQNIKEENLFDLSQAENLKNDDVAEYQSSIKERGVYQIRTNGYAYHLSQQADYQSRPWFKIIPDQKELWIRIYPDDIVVHSHEEALTPHEMESGKRFWETWQHEMARNPLALARERNPEYQGEKPLTAAWTTLQAHFGASRAAWIMKQTNPDAHSNTHEELKSDPWTEAIQAFVLPDKFVATLNQGDISKSFEGKRIPHPLPLSPLPSPDATLDEISWVKGFEEAERIGMAIRIPIEKEGFAPTEVFDQLIVVGVKTSAGADEGKELLEKLLDNHRYKRAGMAILPQGTATNNFEQVRSGYTERGLPAEETFKLVAGPPQFSLESEWSLKKDGQYLVEALGIDPTVFNRVQAGDTSDIAYAKAMHRLLWPATLGYYLHQFWQPLISPEAAEKTRDFLWDFVAGSGLLPVFRVGKQPYGVGCSK